MKPTTYNAPHCPVSKTLRLIGGKWKPLILYLIEQGENRFSMMKKRMPAISKKVLTTELRDLEKDGLISREVILPRAPQLVIYQLTERGQSLRQLIDDIFTWGSSHLLEFTDQAVL